MLSKSKSGDVIQNGWTDRQTTRRTGLSVWRSNGQSSQPVVQQPGMDGWMGDGDNDNIHLQQRPVRVKMLDMLNEESIN